MPYAPKILAFAGATRTGSYNKKVIRIAAEGARRAGAEVTLIDLRDFPMPLYDGDLEEREGLPAKAKEFKKMMLSHDGLLISTPEYNSSLPGVLKNALDWASRSEAGEKPLSAYEAKVACLMSASPGGLGGLRSLTHLRQILSNIKVLVLPEQQAVVRAGEAFDTEDRFKDSKMQNTIEGLGARLTQMLVKLHSS